MIKKSTLYQWEDNMKDDDLLTLKEICLYFHCTRQTIWNWEKKLNFPLIRIEKKIYGRKNEIEEWLEQFNTANIERQEKRMGSKNNDEIKKKMGKITKMAGKEKAIDETEEVKFPFDDRFQLKIISMLIMNDELCKKHISYIQADYFINPIHKEIFKRLVAFYNKYKRAPKSDEIWEEIKIIKEKDNRIPKNEVDYIANKMLDMVAEGDFDYISDNVLDFVRNQAVRNALLTPA